MHHKRKLVLLSCFGSILEYYDFIIYGMMAIYLSEIFFSQNSVEINSLKTFSMVSVGYLMRPIGGYVFGVVADIYGRKKMLIWVMSTMAFATLMMGALPTYAQIGIASPLLLTLARMLQGLSFGAEMPSLAAIIKESTQQKQSGKYFGLVMSSTGFGALLASGMVFIISRYCATQEITDWAWRIPFLFGGILALFVLIIRNRLDETPDFVESQRGSALHRSSKEIMKDLYKNYPSSVWCGMLLTIFFSYLILFSLYLPVYLNRYFNYPKDAIFSALSIGMLVTVFLSPIFGHVLDRMDRIHVIRVLVSAFLLFWLGALSMFKQSTDYRLVIFFIGYQIFISAYATNLLSVLSDLFPLPVRATGIGVCYNVAYALASLICLALTSAVASVSDNHALIVLGVSTFVVFTSLYGSVLLKKRQARESMRVHVNIETLA